MRKSKGPAWGLVIVVLLALALTVPVQAQTVWGWWKVAVNTDPPVMIGPFRTQFACQIFFGMFKFITVPDGTLWDCRRMGISATSPPRWYALAELESTTSAALVFRSGRLITIRPIGSSPSILIVGPFADEASCTDHINGLAAKNQRFIQTGCGGLNFLTP